MRIRLLGDIEAIGDDGGVMAISASKPRRLLALLALGAGRMTPLDAIIDDLWGDQPPPSTTNLVQGYISALRKLIGPSLIRTTPGGYLLDVHPGAIDVTEFEQHIVAAFAASSIDPSKAVDLVADALDLWLGQPFGERLAGGQLGAAAAGLVERRLEAIELGIRCELAVGHHDGLTSRLEQLIADHPYREGLWCSLAVVLYRVDRQVDALKRIHDARTMLAEELGVRPGADLVEITEDTQSRPTTSAVDSCRHSAFSSTDRRRTTRRIRTARRAPRPGPRRRTKGDLHRGRARYREDNRGPHDGSQGCSTRRHRSSRWPPIARPLQPNYSTTSLLTFGPNLRSNA